MELGNIGFESDQPVAHLLLQDGIVVLLEELDELVLMAPGHAVEVPDGPLASRWRRGLRPKARKHGSDQYPDDQSEYQRQGFLHGFLRTPIMRVAIFVPLR
jgi:hypothetical protein